MRRVLLTLLLLVAAAPAGAQGIYVALTPWSKIVAPADTFQLDVTAWQAGSAFNAYDAVIGYDTTALKFLPLSPTSLQQGSLMTGACGNTFHVFTAAAGQLTINHSLLCHDLSLTGPGQLYKLRFKAIGPVGTITKVRFLPGLQFYDGGINVNPAYPYDATVMIGYATGVTARDASAAPRVAAWPNPCRGEAVLRVTAPAAGSQRVVVLDAAGRRVRTLSEGSFPAGARDIRWDGRDQSGARAPAGVYLVSLTAAGRTTQARLALLR